MEQRNNTAAVVVTYNRKELLAECIRSLQGQTYKPDILIIDNASTDGTEEMLAPLTANEEIIYQNTGSNLGGAGGFEYGMKKAVEAGYEYVWIMDDDSIPEKNALEMLFKADGILRKQSDDGSKRLKNAEQLTENAEQLTENAEQPAENTEQSEHKTTIYPYGYLSSKTLWKDGSLCNMNLQRDPSMNMIKDYERKLIPSGTATFVSLFVPSAVVKEVGLPIGEFFIWADDLEYTRRISRKYPCYVVTDSVVVHKCPTNNGGNISTDEVSRINRYRYAYRNEVYVYRREGIKGFLHVLARTPLHIFRVLRYSEERKGERIRVILGSTLKGIGFRPEIRFPEDTGKQHSD